jgi:predicted ATPase/class 3 adenylate cyclase
MDRAANTWRSYARAVEDRDGTSGHRLPTGTLTFLFSDIEGSTRLVQAMGDAFPALLERHQALLRQAFEDEGGVEVATEGDSFFVVFRSAMSAILAAAAAQRALADEPWPAAAGLRVRIGLHTGEGTLGGDNYVGLDVHRAARIGAAAHGGQILLSDATTALVRGSLPADLELRDLGEYRLKDLDRPERLVQLLVAGLPTDFAPPRTLEAPSNLPPQLTAFVGRRQEAEAVAALVAQSRLVTLSGPGGTGKTRLALEVASRVKGQFSGGVFFVDLSALTDPALIPTSIATVLGIREEPGRPVMESLESHLRELQLLLVLDNFEQLLAGAPLVGRLLEAAPRSSVLVTSREVLHIRGEQEYAVQPLGLPDLTTLPPLEALSQYDAVALFIRRAQAVRADFTVDNQNAPAVAAICTRLDGLPLAIELAAARTKVLAPDAILSRLQKSLSLLTSSSRDLSERQRTLRGAIDWSYELLDGTERVLFRRLGIFVGGCSIENAEAVCDPDGELGVDMLDSLSSLVDKSLLRQLTGSDNEPRFRMLETVREYAQERLAESTDGDDVRRAHWDLFSTLAGQASGEIMGPRRQEWTALLERDRDNLRAAVQRLADHGEIARAQEMAAALWRFWQVRGNLAEGRATLESLLARDTSGTPSIARAKALSALGGLEYWQSDMEAAERAYVEGLDMERQLDDPLGLVEALYNLGFVKTLASQHAAARALHEEALEIATRVGDRMWTLRVREALAFVMFHMGEYKTAQELQWENVRAFRAGGETFRVAIGSGFLSYLEARDGRFAEARAMQREALGIFRQTDDRHSMVRQLMLTAAAAVFAGELELAARLCGAYDAMREPLGEMATPIDTLHLPDPAAQAREGLGDEEFERAYSEGRSLSLDEVAALLE